MRLFTILAVLAMLVGSAQASTARYLNGQYITNGAYTLTIPGITDTLVTLTGNQTLTTKTMSGSSNTFSNIPVGAIGNGSVLSGTNTGDVTASAFGAVPNANGFTLTGQALNLQPADSTHPGGLLAADWSTFNGKIGPSAFSAKGDILVGTASGAYSPLGVSTNGYVLTADSTGGGGTVGMKWAAVPSVAPSLNGSTGTPQSISAGTGIALSSIAYTNLAFIAGNGGAVVVSATPSITAGTAVGQTAVVLGTSDTNTVKLQDEAGLSGSTLRLNGDWIGAAHSVLSLVWDGTYWVEMSRQ
jgi:trimeric autotransporter adhesin